MDFYREMLSDYSNEQPQKSKLLQTFLDEGKIADYQTTVHALKSTSKTIGAMEVSELARKLEMMAKEKDVDGLKELHPELMDRYKELAEKLLSCLQ